MEFVALFLVIFSLVFLSGTIILLAASFIFWDTEFLSLAFSWEAIRVSAVGSIIILAIFLIDYYSKI